MWLKYKPCLKNTHFIILFHLVKISHPSNQFSFLQTSTLSLKNLSFLPGIADFNFLHPSHAPSPALVIWPHDLFSSQSVYLSLPAMFPPPRSSQSLLPSLFPSLLFILSSLISFIPSNPSAVLLCGGRAGERESFSTCTAPSAVCWGRASEEPPVKPGIVKPEGAGEVGGDWDQRLLTCRREGRWVEKLSFLTFMLLQVLMKKVWSFFWILLFLNLGNTLQHAHFNLHTLQRIELYLKTQLHYAKRVKTVGRRPERVQFWIT